MARQLNRSWRAGREAQRDRAQPQEKREASIMVSSAKRCAGLTTPAAPLRSLRDILLMAQPPLLCELCEEGKTS